MELTKKTNTKGGFTMLKDKNNQLSICSILYNKIPENHILKLINKAVCGKENNQVNRYQYRLYTHSCQYYKESA
jgi:hypothetical protein